MAREFSPRITPKELLVRLPPSGRVSLELPLLTSLNQDLAVHGPTSALAIILMSEMPTSGSESSSMLMESTLHEHD